MERRTLLWIGAGAVAVAAAAVALTWSAPERPPADPANARQVAAGEKLYARECAACHGAKLEGEGDWRKRKPSGRMPAPPHDATGHTWHHPDTQLFALTKAGVKPPLAPPGYESDMPGFAAKLDDAEIWAVLAFIKSRWPPDIRERQPNSMRQRGRQ